MLPDLRRPVGAFPLDGDRCRFVVWAPRVQTIEVVLTSQRGRSIALQREAFGYHTAEVEGVRPGDDYVFSLDGGSERPDPASRHQPHGVHGASRVVDLRHDWRHPDFRPGPLADAVLYELHVGTFTEAGTFAAAAERLDHLVDLGVTAVEVMPVAQFPGARNWGYDGVELFAVHDAYGGPRAFQAFVDACHGKGLAVVLDVVYNHLGPEGNYLREFGPYFTDAHRTPWGEAVNVEGADSDHVRNFFVQNALQWARDFRVDGLRLDAVHALVDTSARPFLAELARAVRDGVDRPVWLIAESDDNDPRVVRDPARGGLGFHAQWCDDFHHALHSLLTRERSGYYLDFGRVEHLARAWREGFVYQGEYSRHRRRRHGARPDPGARFVVCAQNHDQIGNRMLGERIATLGGDAAARTAAVATLLSPHVPLLFMGEEWGETAPWLYFTSHGDPDLVRSVRQGRKREFAAFRWAGEPPDPQSAETFARSRLRWPERAEGEQRALLDLYRFLIRLRRELPRQDARVASDETLLTVDLGRHRLLLHAGEAPREVGLDGEWRLLADTATNGWDDPHPVRTVTLPPVGFALIA